ncbi:hypothetical protein TNCV_4825751 [Trichonephila clavipes]|uniref:Uncharacterized protein n=1 Tax=Trichonephila clavipes TaxID=2585209 RepID=A0A8X6RJY2_TRICX|nr:hypothetical protein TNCV_4825751 [Trichonephila clavipes]
MQSHSHYIPDMLDWKEAIWLAKEVSDKLACAALNSESRIGKLPWASPDTSLIIVRTQLEVGFVAKHYTSSSNMIPT